MPRTVLHVAHMDCPSEERLIRLALAPVEGVGAIHVDLPARTVMVEHSGAVDALLERLAPLELGVTLAASPADGDPGPSTPPADEAPVLRALLVINAVMFAVEGVSGVLAGSAGLVADGMDMAADAAVYGLALRAVGGPPAAQLHAARAAGWLQLGLGLAAAAEVVRRVAVGGAPTEAVMVGVGTLALAANAAGLVLLARHRDRGVHLRATWIFTSTDVLANLAVMGAAGLVGITGSAWPDRIVGAAVAAMILAGAARILRLR